MSIDFSMEDVDLDRIAYMKLQKLDTLTRAGAIQIIVRLQDQDILRSYFYRKYAMHPDTAKNALEALESEGLIQTEIDGRKKRVTLTTKGKKIASLIDTIVEEL